MTVEELIEELEKHPDDTEILGAVYIGEHNDKKQLTSLFGVSDVLTSGHGVVIVVEADEEDAAALRPLYLREEE